MSFLDHLEDLRWHLIRSPLALLLWHRCFYCKEFIFEYLFLDQKT